MQVLTGQLERPTTEPTAWHPRLRQVHDYWRSIRPSCGFPGRHHLNPAAISHALPTLWMLAVHRNPLRLKYRLVGTRIVEVAGRELTGRWLDEAHPGTVVMTEAMLSVVNDGAVHWRRGRPTLFLAHKNYIEVERVLLPLAADGRTVDIVLACSVFYASDGRAI